MKALKTKRKFDLNVVMRTWGTTTIVGAVVMVMLVAIIASSSSHLDKTTLSLWGCFGVFNSFLYWVVHKAWRRNNGFLVNNFMFVRIALGVLSGAIYGSSAYLFLNDLTSTAQILFLVAMLSATYVAIPIYYDFILGFSALWALIWIPYNIASTRNVNAVLIFALAFTSLATGLFLCRVLSGILSGAFVAQQKFSSAATSLDAENSDMKLFFLAANHDLAQPLTAIEYALRTLEDSGIENLVIQQAVKNIKTASSTLGRLISDIIHFEKITSSNEQLKVVPTPLFPIFDRIVRQLEGLANDKDIGIRARMTTRIANVDGFLLERVLRNLVENAIRNTVSGAVVLAARPRGNMVSIEVWDTGVGIAPENLGNVFDLFHQAPKGDGTKIGHGIGLTIVRALSEKMGSTIVVNSVRDHGSVFSVLVPAWIPKSDELQAQFDARQKPRLQPVLKSTGDNVEQPWAGLNIGLVEDDDTLRQQISSSFIARGATVYQGRSSAEIVDAVDNLSHTLSVLVTDWNLGNETGETAKDILSSSPGFVAPWVVISGDIEPADAERLRATGVSVLMKPFGPDRLINMINDVLR